MVSTSVLCLRRRTPRFIAGCLVRLCISEPSPSSGTAAHDRQDLQSSLYILLHEPLLVQLDHGIGAAMDSTNYLVRVLAHTHPCDSTHTKSVHCISCLSFSIRSLRTGASTWIITTSAFPEKIVFKSAQPQEHICPYRYLRMHKLSGHVNQLAALSANLRMSCGDHLNFSDTDYSVSSSYGQVEIEDDELPSGRHE